MDDYAPQGISAEVPESHSKDSADKKVGRIFLTIVILITIIGGSIAIMPIIICLFILAWPIAIPLVIFAGIAIYKKLGKISKK